MSNENSETFIGLNSSWSVSCCRTVTYLGDKYPVARRGDSKQATYYVNSGGIGEILTLPVDCIDSLNDLYIDSSASSKKLIHRMEALLRLVMLSRDEAFAFISKSCDLSYFRRLGYRMVILGSWAVVL